MSMGNALPDSVRKAEGTPMFERSNTEPKVHKLVLTELLNPRHWRPSENRRFFLEAEQINELCDLAERIFREEPSVLRLKGMLCRPRRTANIHKDCFSTQGRGPEPLISNSKKLQRSLSQ